MVASTDAVVGRAAELAAIDVFLGREPDGGRVLLLEGEPGIGKTTLWQAGVAAAGLLGHRVLRAQPVESEKKLSYAALADLIGASYDGVRRELPEPQRNALDAALLRSGGSADARTIGSALVSVLTVLAREAPVVVAIDDAQWLDRASARGLEFAARRLPDGARLLLAQRPDGAALDLERDQVTHVGVGPLSLGALHHILHASLGSAPARPTLVRIAETSAGNPFFALAIARTLGERDHLGGPLPVPASVRDLVAGRIDALSPAAREAVLVVSALSRPSARTPGVTPEALAEAEEAGVLVVEGSRVRFTHPLPASVVYSAAGGARRLELHRRLADLVEDPEERAHHLALSTAAPNESVAAELEAPAASAGRRGAQDAAAELSRAAPADRGGERRSGRTPAAPRGRGPPRVGNPGRGPRGR